MTKIDVSEVDHELLAKALAKLEMVDISETEMTNQQKKEYAAKCLHSVAKNNEYRVH